MEYAIQIKELLLLGKTGTEIVNQLGCPKSLISYHKKKLNLPLQIQNSTLNDYNWEEISSFYKLCGEIPTRRKYHIPRRIWVLAVNQNFIVLKIRKLSDEDIFKKDGVTRKKRIKNKLKVLFGEHCKICNQGPIHNEKPLVLQLDHINGNNRDNRIENLRLVCPNCHSQTETYAGKNKKSIDRQPKEYYNTK